MKGPIGAIFRSERGPWVLALAVVALGLPLALVVASWGDGTGQVIKAGEVSVFVAEQQTAEGGVGGPGATVTVLSDGCLGVIAQGRQALVVWPHGTTVSGEGKALVLTSEGKQIRVGDVITFGLLQELDDVGRLEPFNGSVPHSCRQIRAWVVGDIVVD